MNEKAKRELYSWLAIMSLLFIIFVLSIIILFLPVQEYIGDKVVTNAAISLQGGKLLAESWYRYPQYSIGLGVIAIVSVSGGCSCVYIISKKREQLECKIEP